MSFVLATPELMTTAAQDLAAIRSTLGEASATAAAPTTALAAAAEDEISTGIAALFGAFGSDYQAISAQAQAFHEQLIDLLTVSGGAYLSAETAATATVTTGGFPSLVANTTANLQTIADTWTNQTVPILTHAVTGYPQLISTSLASGNALPLLAIPANLAQGSATLYQAFSSPVSLSLTSLTPSGISLGVGLGLPQLLALNALGAPVNAGLAVGASGTAFFGALQAGDTMGAISTLADTPANIANGFLNGSQTLSMQLSLPGLSVAADIPFSGLLSPLQPLSLTATTPVLPLLNSLTITGPPVGGLVPSLVQYVPELLATSLGP
ncbi:PE family protein [Mycobacterium ulcerans]|uniref:PE family protein n=1 Tax=Mycobacterium ulcerans subsp. shinshuense TaxID=1124626 RepID=A0A1B4XXH7_MYCUL|nr:PE family protein [Mycobacterium ulcerans]BAV39505.1 PE family protein [Mycobacterium ulcerans subsp. shinshuense]